MPMATRRPFCIWRNLCLIRDRGLPRPVDSQHVRAERTDLLDDRLAEDRVPQPADFLARRDRMLLAEAELPRARMDVRTRIVRGSLDQAGFGQVARDPGLRRASAGPPRYGRDRDSGPSRGGFSRDRDERGPKSPGEERLRCQGTWHGRTRAALGEGRRSSQKRPLPAGRHSLPVAQNSTRGGDLSGHLAS